MMQPGAEDFVKSLIEFALKDKKSPRRWHITRLYMYRRLENALAKHDGPDKTCLSIAKSEDFAAIMGLNQVSFTSAIYPEVDMRALPYPDNHFDFTVADQVLEHVAGDPIAAFAETVRVTKPGGFVVQTTCFFNLIHQAPTDYWRFTPMALQLICDKTGVEPVLLGGWGNQLVWSYMSMGYRMAKVPENPDNPLYQLGMRNEKKYPLSTWVVARKPEA